MPPSPLVVAEKVAALIEMTPGKMTACHSWSAKMEVAMIDCEVTPGKMAACHSRSAGKPKTIAVVRINDFNDKNEILPKVFVGTCLGLDL